MLLERGSAVAARLGEGDPELQGVERDRIVAERVLGVGDARAARHEVERAAAHEHVAADRVAVAHFADQGPGHGLQPDVRVRLDAHLRLLRAETVEKAPGADQGQVALGKSAVHFHRPHPAERHLARLEQHSARPAIAAPRWGAESLRRHRAGVEPGHDASIAGAKRLGQSMFKPWHLGALEVLHDHGALRATVSPRAAASVIASATRRPARPDPGRPDRPRCAGR